MCWTFMTLDQFVGYNWSGVLPCSPQRAAARLYQQQVYTSMKQRGKR